MARAVDGSEKPKAHGNPASAERDPGSNAKAAERKMKETADPARKGSPGAAQSSLSTEETSSIKAGSGNPAGKDADGLEATRLLNVRPLANSDPSARRERGSVLSQSPQSVAGDVSRRLSSEDKQQVFDETLPGVAGDDESTRFFQLSVPERGPIRWEPGSIEDLAESSGNAGEAFPEKTIERETPLAVPDIDRQVRVDQPGMPVSATRPEHRGKLYALLPGLAILNLSLSLLVLVALLWVVFHGFSGGR